MVTLWLTETDEGRTVIAACARPGDVAVYGPKPAALGYLLEAIEPDLVVVCGWRRIIKPWHLRQSTFVGFHSAKLPEYPGRAPVPWTLVRRDREAWTTLFYLDEGVDTGDIIDSASVPVTDNATVESIYADLAQADIALLRKHLDGILAGSAPRTPQDPAKRGPLTTKDGWDRLRMQQPEWIEAFG